MKLTVLKRDLEAARKEAMEMRSKWGDDLTDEQRTQADEVRSRIEALEADIGRVESFDALAQRADADKKRPERQPAGEWERRAHEFSLRKAIMMAMGKRSNEDFGLEREVSDEVQRRSGLAYEGVAAPFEALAVRADWLETRDVSTTTPAAGPGSRITPVDYRPGERGIRTVRANGYPTTLRTCALGLE
jgi:hypothetical protein